MLDKDTLFCSACCLSLAFGAAEQSVRHSVMSKVHREFIQCSPELFKWKIGLVECMLNAIQVKKVLHLEMKYLLLCTIMQKALRI